MRARILVSAALASLVLGSAATAASAHPDNDNTLHFVLTCDDGHVWNAAFNGGPSAFHLDGGALFVWKEIAFVTPAGESGTVGHGINGFDAASLVTCTYIGAVSGNHYTVTGFYPPRG